MHDKAKRSYNMSSLNLEKAADPTGSSMHTVINDEAIPENQKYDFGFSG
jgi:hypothetical protein